jgi:hypothetical protein
MLVLLRGQRKGILNLNLLKSCGQSIIFLKILNSIQLHMCTIQSTKTYKNTINIQIGLPELGLSCVSGCVC